MVESSAPQLKQNRVCYIDDSKTSAFVTKKILRQAGYDVDHFPDAESAIEAILDRDYDFVITDLMISAEGGVNGDDLINIIRRSGHPIKSRLPIVVVTSASDTKTHDELRAAGANAVLVKPLNADQLQQTVTTLSVSPVGKTSSSPAKFEKTTSSPISSDKTKPSLDEISLQPIGVKASITPPLPPHAEKEDIPTLTEEIKPKAQKPTIQREIFFHEETPTSSNDEIRKKNISPKRTTVDIPLLEGIPLQESDSVAKDDIPVEQPIPAVDAKTREDQKPFDSKLEIKSSVKQVQPEPEPQIVWPTDDSNKNDKKMSFDELVAFYESEDVPQEKIKVTQFETEVGGRSNVRGEPVKIKTVEPIAPAKPEMIAEPTSKDASHTEIDPLQAFFDKLEKEEKSSGWERPAQASAGSRKVSLSPKAARIGLVVLALAMLLPPLFYMLFRTDPIKLDAYTVDMGPIHESITVPGKVVSKKQINVTGFFVGQIKEIMVKEGDTVKKGQTLAKLDDREIRTKVGRAEAQRISLQENVAAAAKTMERLQRALNLGAVSRQMVEDAEATWKSLSAKQSLADEELKEAKLLLERAEIVAPFDGVVSTLQAQAGQVLTPPEPLLKLVDTSNIEIELKVDASDSAAIREGQAVSLSSDAFPGKTWNETIKRISTTANRDTTSNMLAVYTSLGSEAPPLKVGQQVDGEVRVSSNNRALLVPFEAIKTINGQTMVAVDVNGQLHYVPITTGIESLTHVEVTQGVALGQKILLLGGLTIEEGQPVVIANVR